MFNKKKYNLNDFSVDCHQTALDHGFWDDLEESIASEALYNNMLGNKLMLIVSELSEAQESLRNMEGIDRFEEELADVFIRTADLCGQLQLDIDTAVLQKMEKNKNRPHKHDKAF
jgi:NTP pyrophosphatase (non-canonical NTP hydrolase)